MSRGRPLLDFKEMAERTESAYRYKYWLICIIGQHFAQHYLGGEKLINL